MIRTRTRTSAATRRTARVAVEQLEDRSVPSTVDLSVTKMTNTADASGNVNAGQPVQYTVVVSNAGPGTATGATVSDTLPAGLSAVTWTSVSAKGAAGGAGSGNGNINEALTLPAGATVTYTITGTLAAAATGTLSNTATATAGAADVDANTANNSATVSNHVVPTVDLSVTKTDNATAVAAGQQVQYTVVVTNAGQTAVTGATLTDTLPVTLTGVTFTSTASGGATGNTAGGNGNLSETLTLPAGSSVTYTITGTVAAGTAVGTSIANTATVSTPAGVTDNLTSNNSATDTDTVVPGVDVSITKTDNLKFVVRGDTTTYTIVVSNVGTTPVTGANVVDTLPAELSGATWTSTSAGGALGSAGSGTGNINETLTLPAGATVTYTLKADVTGAARGGLTNTATVTAPGGVVDINAANNTAEDRDTVLPKPVPAFLHQFLVAGSNGLVRLFGPDGSLLAQGFPLAGLGYTGPLRVALGDLTGDGVEDFVFSATQGRFAGLVEVIDGATLAPVRVLFPFPGFGTGLNVAIGDVNGDGFNDLVIGTASGASLVQAYDVTTGQLLSSFFAFPGYTGGVSLAVANVDGVGADEIVVGAASGPPVVAVYDAAGKVLDAFLAYTNGYMGGVNVAAGDVLGNDGKAEILVAPASGGAGGVVELFQFGNHTPAAAAPVSLPGPDRGLRVAIRDVDGDGDLDLVFAPGPGHGSSRLLAVDLHPLSLIRNFDVIPGANDGIFLG